ncbi:MAG TPA: sialidase family protein [Terriglobales bacterium]|nr:sialidase family protein [Terriglobales bacterium]
MHRALLLPDGRLIALSIARENGQQTMQARYSFDNGEHWSEPENLFLWPKEAGGFGLFEALVDKDGEIHIWSLCDGNSGILYRNPKGKAVRPGMVLDIWHVRSNNRRNAWTQPKAIWTGHGSDLLSAIQLHNGRLVLPYSFNNGERWESPTSGFHAFSYSGPYRVSVLYSDDNGDSWHQSPDVLSVQTPDLSTYGADEPVVIQLKNGRVWMLIRTQRGRFYESFSDDGSRWSTAEPTQLYSSDSPAGLLRLKDGSILLISNACLRYPYAYGARNVLHGAISSDEGETWRGFRELVRDPARDDPPDRKGDYGISYSFPTLTKDGKVLFSNWVESGRSRTFRLFDPSWLLETKQSTDFSNGIDEWSVFGSKGVSLAPDPSKSSSKALAIRKLDAQWPAAAVWNFPVGAKGRLHLEIMLRDGFGGALIGLTDHFSVPWDLEDRIYNAISLPINSDGNILSDAKLAAGRWHSLLLEWDAGKGHCRISVDGKPAGVLGMNRRVRGINYLRIRSVANRPDSGLLIRSVSADVTDSWSVNSAAAVLSGQSNHATRVEK